MSIARWAIAAAIGAGVGWFILALGISTQWH